MKSAELSENDNEKGKELWGEKEISKLVEVFFMGTGNVKYSVVRNAALEAFCDLVQTTKGLFNFYNLLILITFLLYLIC